MFSDDIRCGHFRFSLVFHSSSCLLSIMSRDPLTWVVSLSNFLYICLRQSLISSLWWTEHLNRHDDVNLYATGVFLYKWTVNWKFLPESIFLSRIFHISLLVCHALGLLWFFRRRWVIHEGSNWEHSIQQIVIPLIEPRRLARVNDLLALDESERAFNWGLNSIVPFFT